MKSETKPGKPTDDNHNHEPVRALSDSTIRETFTILRQALDSAVRDELLARNPSHRVERPGVRLTEARHLDTSTVSALLVAAEGLRYAPVLKLIASTGLRRGEALALRWSNVDLRPLPGSQVPRCGKQGPAAAPVRPAVRGSCTMA